MDDLVKRELENLILTFLIGMGIFIVIGIIGVLFFT